MRQTTHAGTHNSAGPLADAGPYDYAPPVVHGGGQPLPAPAPVPAPRPAWKNYGLALEGAIVILLAVVVAVEFQDLSRLSFLHWYMTLYCAFTVLTYWKTPKPRQSFLSWTLRVIGIFLNFFVALVTVPQSLRGLLPDSLAFGLPAFVIMLIFHWVPPLIESKKPPPPLWRRLLSAAIFAAFWAWMTPGIAD
jgi:hypothetical protein